MGGWVIVLITLGTGVQYFVHDSVEVVLWFVTFAQRVCAVGPHEQEVSVGNCVIPEGIITARERMGLNTFIYFNN